MPPPTLRSVIIGSVVGLGLLVALILLSPQHEEKLTPKATPSLRPPTLPPLVRATRPVVSSNPEAFAPWNREVDNFLRQPWRTSRFSAIGSRVRIGETLPTTTASFDRLVEALPPAQLWRQLPDITRARLQVALPKTSEETLAWTDQRLFHLWALVLNLPRTRDELRSTLDELRTVRWLVDKNKIQEVSGHELDREFANRLGAVDQRLRARADSATLGLPAAEVWRDVARQAAQSPQERLSEEVGEDMYTRLRSVTRRARWSERLDKVVPFNLGPSNRESDTSSDPAASALLSYGPLTHAANAALGLDVPGASGDGAVKVPDLLPGLTEAEALPLIAAAQTAQAGLDWTDAPQTLVLTARALADGRLRQNALGLRSILTSLMDNWPEPTAPRAEAGLALLDAVSKAARNDSSTDDADDTDGVYRQFRALCLVALGKGAEADSVLGDTEFRYWEPLDKFPPSAAASIAEFSLRRLARHPGSSLHWWELMERNAHQAGRGVEALSLLKAKRGDIDGSADELIVTATEDAGRFAEAADLLLEKTNGPMVSEGWSPTQRRADALWVLLNLGEGQHRPEWTRTALDRLAALMSYWQTERDGSSDGGAPWEKWPGKLVELGRLDLALSAAKLNVRWRAANSDADEIFLMSTAERKNAVRNGPGAAMTGLVHILALQKKPQEVIDYLVTEELWPGRDVNEIASLTDPSFPETQRRKLGVIVADALLALGRKDEAARVRSSLEPGWEGQLRNFLASDAGAAVPAEKRTALRYLLNNELPDDFELDLVDMAQAVESVPFVVDERSFPQDVFPLTAATAKLNHQFQLGERVPTPPIANLRTYLLSSASDLAPMRDALLANVPNRQP